VDQTIPVRLINEPTESVGTTGPGVSCLDSPVGMSAMRCGCGVNGRVVAGV
jgi:hypothetical protein